MGHKGAGGSGLVWLKALQDAKTLKELNVIKLDDGDPALIVAIRDALHPGPGKSREKLFRPVDH